MDSFTASTDWKIFSSSIKPKKLSPMCRGCVLRLPNITGSSAQVPFFTIVRLSTSSDIHRVRLVPSYVTTRCTHVSKGMVTISLEMRNVSDPTYTPASYLYCPTSSSCVSDMK